MTLDDLYKAWKKERGETSVDTHFVDSVMQQVAGGEVIQGSCVSIAPGGKPVRLAWCVQAAVAVIVVGLGIGLIRASSMVLFLLLYTSQGY